MKIGLASIHPRRVSGQIESLAALATELEALGHSATLISAFGTETAGGRQHRIPPEDRGGASAASKLARVLRAVRRIAASGREFDVLHVYLPTPAFSWLGDLLQLRLSGGPPIIVGYEAHLASVRTVLVRRYLLRDPRFYLPRLAINNGIWGRLSCYQCARYVVAGEWQKAEVRALGADEHRVVSLPNLANSRKLRAMGKGTARQAVFPGLEEGPLIGWAGHFHHVKGVDTLLSAFAKIRLHRPGARLALAWSGIGNPGPIGADIARLGLGDSVLRLGWVDIGLFLSALDVLALPYRLTMGQGAYPNLVLEAMVIGVPLALGDLPLLRELAAGGRTALLTPVDDPSALAASIERLIDDRPLAAAMVGAQRSLMVGDLAPHRLAARYVALYEQVLQESGRMPTRPTGEGERPSVSASGPEDVEDRPGSRVARVTEIVQP